MEGLLAKIVERKREDLAKVKANLPLRDLKSRLRDMEPARDFYEAISGRGKRRVNLIAEIKKKSPVKGVLIEDLKVCPYYNCSGVDGIFDGRFVS